MWNFCTPCDILTTTMLDKDRISKTNINPKTNIIYHYLTFETPIFVTLAHSVVSSSMMVLGTHTLEVNKFNASMFQGPSSMCRSRSIFFKINGWASENRVVPCAHPSHPRTGTPHEWVSHILCCARTGAKGPAVLTVTRRTCAA